MMLHQIFKRKDKWIVYYSKVVLCKLLKKTFWSSKGVFLYAVQGSVGIRQTVKMSKLQTFFEVK